MMVFRFFLALSWLAILCNWNRSLVDDMVHTLYFDLSLDLLLGNTPQYDGLTNYDDEGDYFLL